MQQGNEFQPTLLNFDFECTIRNDLYSNPCIILLSRNQRFTDRSILKVFGSIIIHGCN
jgi:hypothetical protein